MDGALRTGDDDRPRAAGAEEEGRLRELGVMRLTAGNPGMLTLSGTNSWIVGQEPAYVVDPGPNIESHLEALVAQLERRGGLGGVALTHDHPDHEGAVPRLLEMMPAPLAAARGKRDVGLVDGTRFGPLLAVATPGHAEDHFAFVAGSVCFTGDAVLGEGSVLLTPGRGALSGYIDALERLETMAVEVLCPGHGPPVWEPKAKLRELIEHRLERERRLVEALDGGKRTEDELLDAAWADVPAEMRPFARMTMAVHLDKLSQEGRLPDGVEVPSI